MKCPKCQKENRSRAVFCSGCGKKLVEDAVPEYKEHVRRVSVFFFILLLYIAILRSVSVADFSSILALELVFYVIILVFFIMYYYNVLPLFTFRSLKLLPILAIVGSVITMAFCVHHLAGFINRNILNAEEHSYYNFFEQTGSPLLMSIIFVGVFPALFEEVAFRGILYNELAKITSTWPVIIITSILFTLLHFSIMSAIWLFPGALVLGYLRSKYNTISYGIFAHFAYNTSIVLFELYYR